MQLAAKLRIAQAAAERYVARARRDAARRQLRRIESAARILGCDPDEVTGNAEFAAGMLREWARLEREDRRGGGGDAA